MACANTFGFGRHTCQDCQVNTDKEFENCRDPIVMYDLRDPLIRDQPQKINKKQVFSYLLL